MRPNDHLLIGLGLVVGLSVGAGLTPYFLEPPLRPGSLPGLPEGFGDILGGIVAFGAAYLTFNMQHRAEQARQQEEKNIAADTALMAIGPAAVPN